MAEGANGRADPHALEVLSRALDRALVPWSASAEPSLRPGMRLCGAVGSGLSILQEHVLACRACLFLHASWYDIPLRYSRLAFS